MKLKQLLYGIATFVPGVSQLRAKGTGGTVSAEYCYSVWLRHLVMAKKSGLDTHPKVIAELGPGDSIGIGLAALISGCEQYFAFDVVEHANNEKNLSIFDELVALFKNKTPIPGDDKWPKVNPQLEDYRFPSDILTDSRLASALSDSRLERIRNSVKDFHGKDSVIVYKAPWQATNILNENSVDMIYSQAVLEHVDDLKKTYNTMYLWLKPTGYVSHTIDYKSHEYADEWNGHWEYSDLLWKLVRGKRAYLINREPHSAHIKLMENEGFKVVCNKKTTSESTFTLDQLDPRFRSMTQDDLVTSGAFVQAVKNITKNETSNKSA